MSNIEVKVNAEAIHSGLRRACPKMVDPLLKIMYESIGRPNPAGRKMGHESLADYDVAIQVLEIVNKELGGEANIIWKVHHVPGLIGRFSIDPELLIQISESETLTNKIKRVPGKTGVFYIDESLQLKFKNLLQGHIYALPGHGNTTRALEWIRRRGMYPTWESVPAELKKQVYTNAATLIGIQYPDGSSVASVLHLHGAETLSTFRKVQGQYSVGNRGTDVPNLLHSYDYLIDPNKAIRIVCPNYLGSVANEQHMGVFRRVARDYCLKFGAEGLDVSFDLAAWNTPTDIGKGMLLEHRAQGYVDVVRSLTPNINPNRDATLQVFDILTPTDMIEAINGYSGTSNEERLQDFHNLRDLSERLDAVILLEDLIIGTKDPNNKLKLDFREAVLDGRAAMMRSFYSEEGKDQRFGKEIVREDGMYVFKRKIGSDVELTLQSMEPIEINRSENFEVLVNTGAHLYGERKYQEAVNAFSRARSIIEKRIDEESTKQPNVIRGDYGDYRDILELRVQASAVYHNLSKSLLTLSTEKVATESEDGAAEKNLNKPTLDGRKKLEIKHFADLAFLYNPQDYYLLHNLGNIHREYDMELVDTDEAGALRRARIFYKYSLEQVDQDRKKDSDMNALEKDKEVILTDYMITLKRLVTLGHENLEKELRQIAEIKKALGRDISAVLEQSCQTYDKSYPTIRGAIDSLDKEGRYRQNWIQKASKLLDTSEGEIDERGLIVWATTGLPNHELIKLIGSGAYGIVFEAIHGDTKEYRAVKVIDLLERTKVHLQAKGTDIIDMVVKEYKNAKQQYEDHQSSIAPYVVRVIDVSKDEITQRRAILQELMSGDFYRLQEMWDSETRPKNAKHFTLSLCKALEAIHSVRFYHKDLSPTNILFSEGKDGITYKLGDFGLSESGGEENRLSLSIAAAYIRDPNPEDPAMADLYAVGSNIILAYTGIQPFAKQNPRPKNPDDTNAREEFEEKLQRAKMHREGIDELCKKLPVGINDIASQLMDPNPSKRSISSADELLKRVQEVYS